VIVAYQSKIVMAETLREGLMQIFGNKVGPALAPDRLDLGGQPAIAAPTTGGAVAPAPAPDAARTLVELAAEAQTHMARADKALRDGDFALYGEEIRKVKDLIERMNQIKK